jgi:hypothetical protein
VNLDRPFGDGKRRAPMEGVAQRQTPDPILIRALKRAHSPASILHPWRLDSLQYSLAPPRNPEPYRRFRIRVCLCTIPELRKPSFATVAPP